ncbi:MAG TPA: oxidoreductase [Chloroflexia bacterium]|nr:oxidoreductase [Chloroflexia bacterium]
MTAGTKKPKLAIWKFASCDGCQLSLLDCEDELLEMAGAVDIAYFPEASRVVRKGPYDISLVEGSITTPHDAERIQKVRKNSHYLVAMGACATAGGIQSLRNYANVHEYALTVYDQPHFIKTLEKATPLSVHVKVDYELYGCPVNKHQLVEVLTAYLHGRQPAPSPHSVCIECKARGLNCVVTSQAIPCLGPATHGGCGAICPSYSRGCYGCFGPKDSANPSALCKWWGNQGVQEVQMARAFGGINAYIEAFRKEKVSREH